ncbi:phosphotransferase family protein [Aspergillus stella-maris]|uniref:phosphotransferase family protein n=1 Tax=Aspergillus stella-maris TaxID=1810926 RepID=UPI003CCCD8D3
MDWDERAEASHYAESLSWSGRFNDARGSPIADWVSTFRDNHPSEVVDDYCGSFNWCCRVRFDDGLQWIVRFAVPGRVMNGDEKVCHEVATMRFVKEKTNIPVPAIISWGRSHENPLGLGPFIIMEFIEGVSLDTLLRQGPGEVEAHTLRADISDEELETIYRQIASFLLELSAHDFPRIGSLSVSEDTDTSSVVDSRPLTLKINEIESHGGVRVGGPVSQTFSSATSYFDDVSEQDMQHLLDQPNSVDDIKDAYRKFLYNRSFKAILPSWVDSKHDRGPFKLVCDDFRFCNILVNNAQDLKIVAVLDWEWAYAAPFQMLYSPPRWLLLKKPFDWDDVDISRYCELLKVFVTILEEEEQKKGRCHSSPSLGFLMQRSMEDGTFWFHELIHSCFESPDSTAWAYIRQFIPGLDCCVPVLPAEVQNFVNNKMEQLKQYNVEWAAMKEEIDKKEAEFQALRARVEEDFGQKLD